MWFFGSHSASKLLFLLLPEAISAWHVAHGHERRWTAILLDYVQYSGLLEHIKALANWPRGGGLVWDGCRGCVNPYQPITTYLHTFYYGSIFKLGGLAGHMATVQCFETRGPGRKEVGTASPADPVAEAQFVWIRQSAVQIMLGRIPNRPENPLAGPWVTEQDFFWLLDTTNMYMVSGKSGGGRGR